MEEKKFPLIGDRFPELEVQTTHGKMKLPDDFSGKWFVFFSRFHTSMHDRIRGLSEKVR